jgi:hypothetical protein
MDREAARNKIVFDVELFNETVRDRNVALTMAAEKSRLGSKAGNGKGICYWCNFFASDLFVYRDFYTRTTHSMLYQTAQS